MSQDALNSLIFGWLLLGATIWIWCLAIKEVWLLVVRISSRVGSPKNRRLTKVYDKYHKEEGRINDEVEPKFELWWDETGKEAVEASPTLYKNVGIPFDVDEMPEQMKFMMKGPALQAVSQNAQAFAVLLASKPAHDIFIQEVRRIDAKLADSYADQYERHLDEHRNALAGVGINIDEFEREFSAA